MPFRVTLVCFLLLLVCAPAARAAVPRDFFGVHVDGPALGADGGLLGTEAASIRATGTSSVRVAAYWAQLEPEEGRLELARFDALVLSAARQRLGVLPVVLLTPDWAATGPGVPGAVPRDPSTYARFLTRLVARYGPAGTLWAEHPEVARLPVRRWQVWNEPNLKGYWIEKPWAPGYARLLRSAHDALKRADPGSVVVAAGLTNRSWIDLRKLYAAGARGSFDVAAIHPYTKTVFNVVKLAALARRTMRAAGDARLPLLISEMSWSSGLGRAKTIYGWEGTEASQAIRVRQALTALVPLRRRLGLGGIYWYTWLTDDLRGVNSFDYAGLRRISGGGGPIDKPALRAWRDTIARFTR